MKKMILVLAMLFTFVGLAQAQENSPDTGAVYAGFTTLRVPDIGPLNTSQNWSGLNLQGSLKIVRFGNAKLEAAGDYATLFTDIQKINIAGNVEDVRFHTFQVGPQLSVDVTKRVKIYGRTLFGVVTTFNRDMTYGYLIGLGADVNVTRRLFLRGGFDQQFNPIEGANNLLPESFSRLTFGGGVRF